MGTYSLAPVGSEGIEVVTLSVRSKLGLEVKLQCKLHDPGVARQAADLPEGTVGDTAVRVSEVRVVRHIERIPAQFKPTTLAEGEGPVQAGIELDQIRPEQSVTAAIG